MEGGAAGPQLGHAERGPGKDRASLSPGLAAEVAATRAALRPARGPAEPGAGQVGFGRGGPPAGPPRPPAVCRSARRGSGALAANVGPRGRGRGVDRAGLAELLPAVAGSQKTLAR